MRWSMVDDYFPSFLSLNVVDYLQGAREAWLPAGKSFRHSFWLQDYSYIDCWGEWIGLLRLSDAPRRRHCYYRYRFPDKEHSARFERI